MRPQQSQKLIDTIIDHNPRVKPIRGALRVASFIAYTSLFASIVLIVYLANTPPFDVKLLVFPIAVVFIKNVLHIPVSTLRSVYTHCTTGGSYGKLMFTGFVAAIVSIIAFTFNAYIIALPETGVGNLMKLVTITIIMEIAFASLSRNTPEKSESQKL